MNIKPLTVHNLELLSLKGGCSGSSESIHVKMPYCWKSHVTAQSCLRLLVILRERCYWKLHRVSYKVSEVMTYTFNNISVKLFNTAQYEEFKSQKDMK